MQGDMPNDDRDQVVKEFRDGATKILVSTDVLARGFDVIQVKNGLWWQVLAGTRADKQTRATQTP